MTTIELEQRIAALEKKVEKLAATSPIPANKQWVLKMWGGFKSDPDFEKAMSYGRKWRKAENRKSLRNGKSSRPKKSR
jgi:hypothetical protein